MKRYIKRRAVTAATIQAAEADDNGVDDMIDNISEDFDYVISGIETLNRRGGDDSKLAMSIASEFRVTLSEYIDRVCNSVSGGGRE